MNFKNSKTEERNKIVKLSDSIEEMKQADSVLKSLLNKLNDMPEIDSINIPYELKKKIFPLYEMYRREGLLNYSYLIENSMVKPSRESDKISNSYFLKNKGDLKQFIVNNVFSWLKDGTSKHFNLRF